jgi:alpha-L-glutamate ligase-like protein/uncharacterized protein (TIGR02421 family)
MVSPRDILGMNARNLKYLRPYNLRSAVRLADSKLKTKKVLEAAKIPTPKLYGIFKIARDIDKFNWEDLPANVVLKPNRGFGGEGIVVFSKKATNDKGENVWINNSGEEWTREDFKRHILNILDGNFSLQNIPDVAFFEEKIVTHRNFRKFTYKGLPDIRVIVFNKVPVMSMMRLPTKWSKGKANLAIGALGVGIDMATGNTTTAATKKPVRKVISTHPDTHQDLKGLTIPYWTEVLEIAIRCQEISGLGFIGVDIAIDEKHGPLVLELNARPGLEIQNINLAPLASRLRRVEGLKVDSIAKGVRLAKELFGGGGEKKLDNLISKPVIGVEETVEVITPKKLRNRVLAKIDTGTGLSQIDEILSKKFDLEEIKLGSKGKEGESRMVKINFSLAGEKIETKAFTKPFTESKFKLIIGRRDLTDFIIDPVRREKIASPKLDYKKIDEILVNVNRKIPLISYLTPTNLEAEKNKFFQEDNYNPVFTYEKPSAAELDLLAQRVDKFRLSEDKSAIGKILYRKQQEILKKLELVKAIGSSDFTASSISLYGDIEEDLVLYSEEKYRNKKPSTKTEPFLSQKNIVKIIKQRLEKSGINYKIVIVEDLPSRMAIKTAQKTVLINLRKGAKFRYSDLEGTLAHEIDTHVYRYINGLLQPYQIFSEGLANYLETEEGLAVYNKELTYKNPRKFITRYLKVLAINDALTESFKQTYQNLRARGVLPNTAFYITYKAKRGLTDTSRPGGFTREAVYAKGFREVKKYIDDGFSLEKLYIGKVGIKDLSDIKNLGNIKPAKYLPTT